MTRFAAAAMAVLLAACTFPRVAPTPLPDAEEVAATPPAPPTPAAPTVGATPTPTPSPTPDLSLVPALAAGDRVATLTDGLRVRVLPGTDGAVVVERLPAGAELAVILGPLHTDGFGWYLVADADPEEPAFDEGWIAAGYLPDPFLAPVAGAPRDTRYAASFGHTGSGEFGPVEISDGSYALRWLATDPVGDGCRLDVSLATGSSGAIPAVRDTSSGTPIRGQLHPSYFAENPALVGHVFVTVESDCTWAIGFARIRPDPTPSPGG